MENSPQKTSVKLKFEKIMEKIPTNTELEQIINEQGPLSSIALIELQERRKEQAMQQKPVQGTVAQRVVDDMNAQKQAQMMGIAQMQPQINPDEITPEMINALGNPNVLRASDGAFIGEGTPQGCKGTVIETLNCLFKDAGFTFIDNYSVISGDAFSVTYTDAEGETHKYLHNGGDLAQFDNMSSSDDRATGAALRSWMKQMVQKDLEYYPPRPLYK